MKRPPLARALRRLVAGLDWQFAVVITRLDALQGTVTSVSGKTDAVIGQIAQLEERLQALEERAVPLLRAVLDEEAENRRRLFAARSSDSYERAFDDENPLVSISVATHDRVQLLVERALPSLLAQTHTNLEVIVVGDASPDHVAAAVSSIDDPRLTFANLTQRVRHEDPEHQWLVGSTMARNEAARRARGLWLLHFDDDDSLREDAVAKLLALARERRAEVASGGMEVHGPDGAVAPTREFPPREAHLGWQGALLHSKLRFFERELFAAQLALPGDVYMAQRMLRAGVRFAMLDEVVWDYYPSRFRHPEG